MGCTTSSNKAAKNKRNRTILKGLFNPTPRFQQVLNQCKDETVTQNEVNLLSQLFIDLAARSKGASIDRATFLQFFQLPVRWT